MAPAARWSTSPVLFLLLLLAAATATTTTTAKDGHPSPTPWPERFHAVLFTNLTNYTEASTGPPLRVTDLYYDWPRRRNLNLVRHQLSADPLYDVEWNNGTGFYFDSKACRVEQFPVGVLPPWWLSGGGAEYVGRRVAGGIDCHVWGKAGFIFYYEEARTGRPVRWDFVDVTGIQQFVMSFEPGAALEDDAQWQAPAYCFPDDDDAARSSGEEEAGVGLEAASRLLRKLAGAAATY
ncbi:uncharacterized protein LOC103633108 precursor [Zea mays]|uniref:Uncharacterized protein n=1 Tax=Zea mays TaxID=4577 RepID=A0A1D6IA78_MAIZE|nr:uncharacterized protein LOC103633108 precursor [Zea mays]ONM56893.1 hypothetical protein ZEAMMB73_Zm00001d021340 [Zea mays]|eukprot:XP_008653006.1 uncharacterized protein At4g14100 [Zea mays]